MTLHIRSVTLLRRNSDYENSFCLPQTKVFTFIFLMHFDNLTVCRSCVTWRHAFSWLANTVWLAKHLISYLLLPQFDFTLRLSHDARAWKFWQLRFWTNQRSLYQYVGNKYPSIFHDGSNRNLLCGSDSSRQAASISRDEQSSLQFGDLLLASETATSARRKRVSLLTCMSMLAKLCESISSV